MKHRPLGNTGHTVSALGLGAGQIGDAWLSEGEVGRLLNGALDLGITFVDTARGYWGGKGRFRPAAPESTFRPALASSMLRPQPGARS